MDKLKSAIFVGAVLAAFGGVVVVKALNEEMAAKDDLIRRQNKWQITLNEVIQEHVVNGGELRISSETMDKLEVHSMFITNDLD